MLCNFLAYLVELERKMAITTFEKRLKQYLANYYVPSPLSEEYQRVEFERTVNEIKLAVGKKDYRRLELIPKMYAPIVLFYAIQTTPLVGVVVKKFSGGKYAKAVRRASGGLIYFYGVKGDGTKENLIVLKADDKEEYLFVFALSEFALALPWFVGELIISFEQKLSEQILS